MIAGLFKRWREARVEATAIRAHLQSLFESFLLETQPLVPRAPKHLEAALYRYAWKRAAVLEVLHQRSGSGNLNKPLGGESATVDALTGR